MISRYSRQNSKTPVPVKTIVRTTSVPTLPSNNHHLFISDAFVLADVNVKLTSCRRNNTRDSLPNVREMPVENKPIWGSEWVSFD